MSRNIEILRRQKFDFIIIGGGINGVACAWDAVLKGYSVALFERSDFGSQTSSQSAKIAHSGIRYLQHADFKRLRESHRERVNLMQNAPHLITSRPFLLPVYGHGLKGREMMATYMKTFDVLTMDRKKIKDPSRKIPATRMISRDEALKIDPGMEKEGLVGAAVWHEGLIQNTERLLYSYVRSASEKGALMLNYCEVTKLLFSKDRICGVEIRDLITNRSEKAKASVVINTKGPWIMKNGGQEKLLFHKTRIHPSKALSLVTRPLCSTHAVSFTIQPMYEDKKAIIKKKFSLQFAIPWKGCSLIGSLHLPCRKDDPDEIAIQEGEIEGYLNRINEGYPGANLEKRDIFNILWGIIPAEDKGMASPLKHYKIIDHGEEDGVAGIISVAGVKYTTGRDVAAKAVKLGEEKLSGTHTPSRTETMPLWGGDIKHFNEFAEEVVKNHPEYSREVLHNLIFNYGNKYDNILKYAKTDSVLKECIPRTCVLKAEVVHAVKEEQVQKLSDVILRRTEIGSIMMPEDVTLQACAEIMADEFKWDSSRIAQELEQVKQCYLWNPHIIQSSGGNLNEFKNDSFAECMAR